MYPPPTTRNGFSLHSVARIVAAELVTAPARTKTLVRAAASLPILFRPTTASLNVYASRGACWSVTPGLSGVGPFGYASPGYPLVGGSPPSCIDGHMKP